MEKWTISIRLNQCDEFLGLTFDLPLILYTAEDEYHQSNGYSAGAQKQVGADVKPTSIS